jgi:hypothetical protein
MAIVSYYRFNGNSNDASERSFNGSDTNIVYSQNNGVLNGVAGFNGSSSKISFAGLNYLGAYSDNNSTWSILIRFDTLSKNNYIISYGNGSTFPYYQTFFYLASDNTLRFNYYNGTSSYEYTFGSISDSKWHFITVSFKSDGSIMMSVDSIIKTFSGAVNPLRQRTGASDRTVLGTEPLEGAFGTISVDELKIYSSTISKSSVKNEYSKIKGFFS